MRVSHLSEGTHLCLVWMSTKVCAPFGHCPVFMFHSEMGTGILNLTFNPAGSEQSSLLHIVFIRLLSNLV